MVKEKKAFSLTIKIFSVAIWACNILVLSIVIGCIINYIQPEKSTIRQIFDYDEDADLDTPSLVTKYGYRGETHTVITRDGYILEMHRITGPNSNPSPSGKRVAFLMHGLFSSSTDFIIAGPEKGIGYILANEGYDVWMGNARGNYYSKKHQNYTAQDKDFWMFSWHEIGVEDVPTMIDYIVENTKNDQIFFIGHSQGATTFFVMASEKPEYNDKIAVTIALAPAVYMEHFPHPILRRIVPLMDLIVATLDTLGIYELEPIYAFFQRIAVISCTNRILNEVICKSVVLLIGGYNTDQLDGAPFSVFLGHFPASGSTRQVAHFKQLIESHEFQQYDYGVEGNYLRYQVETPPLYDLSKVTTPVILYYAMSDWLSGVEDVNRLESVLSNVYGKFAISEPNFAHFDYAWGKDVNRLVNSRVIDIMNEFSN